MNYLFSPIILFSALFALASCGSDTTAPDEDPKDGSSSSAGVGSQTGESSATLSSSSLEPGALPDTSSTGNLLAFANCGRRDTTIAVDAYVKLECSINVHPPKGKTISIKALPHDQGVPEGWNWTYTFGGQTLLHSDQTSNPESFSEQTSDRLSIRVMPLTVGELIVTIDLVDTEDATNKLTIPFRVKRVESGE